MGITVIELDVASTPFSKPSMLGVSQKTRVTGMSAIKKTSEKQKSTEVLLKNGTRRTYIL